MSSDEMPIDTGIVFLGHQGKHKVPIKNLYKLTPCSAWEQEWIPSPFIVKGFKSTVSLKFEQNSFLPDCYI